MTLGSEYWCQTFGLCDFESFQAAAHDFFAFPGFLPLHQQAEDFLVNTAWNTPTTVQGVGLTAFLTSTGFHEDSPSGPATVVTNSLVPLLNNNAQEVTSMVTLVIPDCFQVTIQGKAGGHVIDNVIGVRNSAGDAAGAAAAVKAAWEVAGGPLSKLSDLYSMTNYHAVDLSSATGTIADLASTATGGQSTNVLSTRAACALVKWNGGNRSRSTRGRLYFGPVREADVNSDGATLASASITAIGGAFTAFRSSLSASGYPLVVLSRKLAESFDVTSQAVESQIATQRRRIRG